MDKAQEQWSIVNEQQIFGDAMNGWGMKDHKSMAYCHEKFGTGYFIIKEEHLSEVSVYIDKQKNFKLYIKYINEDALDELIDTKGYQTIGKGLAIDMKNNTTIGKYIISYGPCSDESVFSKVSADERIINSDDWDYLAKPDDLANAIGIDLNAKIERQ
ncbi:unnamed protein product [Rotaria sp. Silwood2]|nr:unnamed protein product [Rotaria sp. Silwood2]CAF4504196.1 unnamed protein product [Rotaria sp. Silwood2]